MNEIQIFIPLFPSVPAVRQKKNLLKRLKIHFVNLLQTFFQACTIIRKRQKVYQVSLISSKMTVSAIDLVEFLLYKLQKEVEWFFKTLVTLPCERVCSKYAASSINYQEKKKVIKRMEWTLKGNLQVLISKDTKTCRF